MLIRDSGVVQLFAENAQEAYDLTVLAPRLAEHEDVRLPVLICQDGFTITHSAEPVQLLPDEDVRAFVGEYVQPHALLDVAHPATQGPFAMPDYYFELKAQQDAAVRAALTQFPPLATDLAELTGRELAVVDAYRLDDATRAIVALGSTAGTVKDVVDELRDEGERVGLLRIVSYRPFPEVLVRDLLGGLDSVVVLDRAHSPGAQAPLYTELAAALYGSDVALESCVYGLGGRDLHPEQIREVFRGDAPLFVGLRESSCRV
jgi:pyruvate ferredoxin oxidoreductase alpha subunit